MKFAIMHKMPKEKTFTGPISINTKGVGFFDREPEKRDRNSSIEIQPQFVNRAFHGDVVEVELTGDPGTRAEHGTGRGKSDRPQGRVIRIISRAKDEFVGTVEI